MGLKPSSVGDCKKMAGHGGRRRCKGRRGESLARDGGLAPADHAARVSQEEVKERGKDSETKRMSVAGNYAND